MLSHKNLVLHKFLSNSQEVASAIGVDSSEMKVIAKPDTIEHALGLGWDIERDTFVFQSIAVKDGTRRGVLSTVASLFDPLGLLAPFSLKGKLLLQRLCYSKKGWDEPLSPNEEKEWNSWTSALSSLSSIQIPRCFLATSLCSSYETELHTFSDAITSAYGACSYIRLIDKSKGVTNVSLVMGKSRVVPRKVISIPRLELQARTEIREAEYVLLD